MGAANRHLVTAPGRPPAGGATPGCEIAMWLTLYLLALVALALEAADVLTQPGARA